MTTGIGEAQVMPAEAAPELYPLDEPYTEVEIKVRKLLLFHRLRRPTLDELQRHSRTQWQERVSDDEIEAIIDRQSQCALWDDLVVAVRNYDTNEWRDVDENLKRAIDSSHKEKAMDAAYEVATEFVSASQIDEDALVFRTVGASEIRVRQTIHNRYTLEYTFRKASESEWQKFTSSIWRFREQRIGKQKRSGVRTEFRAGVALFDATILRISGATLNGEEWSDARGPEFVRALDPLFKSLVATTLEDKITPKLRD